MWKKRMIVVLLIIFSSPGLARELTPHEAINFVTGKWWQFSCPFGVNGEGLVRENGCVIVRIARGHQLLGMVIGAIAGDRYRVFGAGTILVHRADDGTPNSICGTAVLGFTECFTVNELSGDHFVGYSSYSRAQKCDFKLAPAPAMRLIPNDEASKCTAF